MHILSKRKWKRKNKKIDFKIKVKVDIKFNELYNKISMKELDINLEIPYDIDEDERKYFKWRYFPNNNIKYNEREDVKTKLLTNVEVIDKYYTSIFYCKGENIYSFVVYWKICLV